MTATIDQIQFYGHNGDPTNPSGANGNVKFANFNPGQNTAVSRYPRVHINGLRITGTNLTQVREVRLSSTDGYRLDVIEFDAVSDSVIIAYFSAVLPTREEDDSKEKDERPPSTGDLTVTIDTTPPDDTDSETDNAVEYGG